MRLVKPIAFVALLAPSLFAQTAGPVAFDVQRIGLTNGWEVTGILTTDGSEGPLTADNIVSWDLKVTETLPAIVWTERNSRLNMSGTSSDGRNIHVATSPDGMLDGGALHFVRRNNGGGIPKSAIVADFTQFGAYLGYVGGMAGWQGELEGLNFVGLNQRDDTRYHAASAVGGEPNVFQISVPTISTDPALMTLSGTITTDGTTGPLLASNFLAWRIVARTKESTHLTLANSVVLSATGVVGRRAGISVSADGGRLVIGNPPRPPLYRSTYVTIADFSDPSIPDGFANYYMANNGVMGEKTPLLAPGRAARTVARRR